MNGTQLDELEKQLTELYDSSTLYHRLLHIFYFMNENKSVVDSGIQDTITGLRGKASGSLLAYLSMMPSARGSESLEPLIEELTGIMKEQREDIPKLCQEVQDRYRVDSQNLFIIKAHISPVSTFRLSHSSEAYIYCPNEGCVRAISRALTGGEIEGSFDRKNIEGYESGRQIGFFPPMVELGIAGMGVISAENQPLLFEALLNVVKDPEYRESLTQ